MRDPIAPGEPGCGERDFRPAETDQPSQSNWTASRFSQQAAAPLDMRSSSAHAGNGATSAAIRCVSLDQIPNGDAPETEPGTRQGQTRSKGGDAKPPV
jgi:hypothetical protein